MLFVCFLRSVRDDKVWMCEEKKAYRAPLLFMPFFFLRCEYGRRYVGYSQGQTKHIRWHQAECPSHFCGITILAFVWKQLKLSLAPDCAHTNERSITHSSITHIARWSLHFSTFFFCSVFALPSHPLIFFGTLLYPQVGIPEVRSKLKALHFKGRLA